MAEGEWPPPGSDKHVKATMAEVHGARLVELRNAAVWPGRTRQSLLDEAAAELTSP